MSKAMPDQGCKSGGFTLIEMMVVVGIVALLASVAVPAYSKYTLRSHRTDAKTALLDLASREQQYYTANNAFTATLTNLGYSSATSVPVGSGSTTTYYLSITVPGGTASANAASFLATATATGSQVNDACGNFTLDSVGVQGNSGSATGCW